MCLITCSVYSLVSTVNGGCGSCVTQCMGRVVFFSLYCYPVKVNVETVLEESIWEDLKEKRKANWLHRKTEFQAMWFKVAVRSVPCRVTQYCSSMSLGYVWCAPSGRVTEIESWTHPSQILQVIIKFQDYTSHPISGLIVCSLV